MPPSDTRTIDVGSPEWEQLLNDLNIEGAPLPPAETPVNERLRPEGIYRPPTPEDIARRERMDAVNAHAAGLLGLDAERYQSERFQTAQEIDRQRIDIQLSYVWHSIEPPPEGHHERMQAEIAQMEAQQEQALAERLGITVEQLRDAQRAAEAAVPPVSLPAITGAPLEPLAPLAPTAPETAPSPLSLSQGGQARNYGATNMPPIADNQVREVQGLLMARYGVGDLGTPSEPTGVDGKWGHRTQGVFERACLDADIDPSTVDFTDPNNPGLQQLMRHLETQHTGPAQPTRTDASPSPDTGGIDGLAQPVWRDGMEREVRIEQPRWLDGMEREVRVEQLGYDVAYGTIGADGRFQYDMRGTISEEGPNAMPQPVSLVQDGGFAHLLQTGDFQRPEWAGVGQGQHTEHANGNRVQRDATQTRDDLRGLY